MVRGVDLGMHLALRFESCHAHHIINNLPTDNQKQCVPLEREWVGNRRLDVLFFGPRPEALNSPRVRVINNLIPPKEG
jgi:hypothetical protein